MALSPGDKLGPYEIVSALGAGGMGEVFKARDTRLNRMVAIKVLREDLVAHAGRKQRFIQEAQAASALNHPNIVTVHDIVQKDGVDCLVMEFVAGKTLDTLIPKHGMRLNEALRVAVQVAEGLRKAHAAGIVHRDIKPSNIMVADDGPVKILDFGLAKLTESAEASGSDSTLTERAETEEGTVMGTVAYMSPEQAEGQKVDSRSDVFSFGALLYEMVSGRRAFGGSSKLSSMSAILKEEPKPVENVPADLEKIIRRCLRKDREKRYQHMDDLKLALEEVREESGSAAVAAAVPSNRKWIVVTACVSIVAVGSWFVFRSKPVAVQPAAQLTRLTFNAGLTTSPALSADGKLLAYASDRASNGEHLDIWVQHMAGGEPVRLTKDEGSESDPNFSPDGRHVAYASSRGGIYVVPVLGGEPRQIAPRGSRPRYSPDGKWIAYQVKLISAPGAGELYLVPTAGGAARRLLPNFIGISSPVWMKDGNSLLAVGRPNVSVALDWWLVPTGAGEPVALKIGSRFGGAGIGQGEAEPAFLDGVYLMFTSRIGGRSQIRRIKLDTVAQKVVGEPETVSSGTTSDEWPALGPDGAIVFSSVQFSSELWQLPIDASSGKVTGEMLRLTEDAALNDTAMITLDGTRIAFLSNRDGNRGIWLRDLTTGTNRKIGPTSGRVVEGPTFPGMTGDGRKIGYEFEEPGQKSRNVVVNVEDGVVQEFDRRGWGLSPSGRFRYIWGPGADAPIQIARIDGPDSHEFMAQTKWLQRSPAMSLDDRWIALHVNETPTKRQIWVMPYQFGRAALEGEWIAITDGKTLDRNPQWSPDGNMLYWIADRDGTRGVWAMKLDPATKRPKGAAFEIKMFPGVRRSMMKFSNTSQIQPAVAKDKIVFALGEESGNIWMTKLP